MADILLLESGGSDGLLLEDGSGVLLMESPTSILDLALADGATMILRGNEPSGTLANDSSAGGANDGTLQANVAFGRAAIVATDTSMDFTATAPSYVDVADGAWKDRADSAFTIITFVKRDVTNTNATLVSLGTTGGRGWCFRFAATGSYLVLGTPDGAADDHYGPITTDTAIHMLAASYDGTNAKLVQDGIDITESSGHVAYGDTSQSMRIGDSHAGSTRFDGGMAYVIYVPSALSVARLAQYWANLTTAPTGSQSLTVGLLDSSSALYAPTLANKYLLTVPLLDSVSALYAPTLANKYLLTVPLLDSPATLYAPVVNTIQYLTVPLLDGAPAVYAPNISLDINLTLLDSNRALYAPNISYTVTLGLLDSPSALYAPTLALTLQLLTIPQLDSVSALYAPTFANKYLLTVPLLDGAPAVYAPNISLDITLGLNDSSRALYAPTIALTAQPIILGLLDSNAALYGMTVSALQIITLPFILDGVPLLYAPDLVGGATQPFFVQAQARRTFRERLMTRQVGPGVFVTLPAAFDIPLLDAGAALYAPTVALRATLTLPLLNSGPIQYAPVFAISFVVPLLDGAPTLYAPTLSPKGTVTLTLIDAGRALYSPVLLPPIKSITVTFLDSTASLYAMTLTKQFTDEEAARELLALGLVTDMFFHRKRHSRDPYTL